VVLGVVGESEEDVEEELAGQLADARLLGHLCKVSDDKVERVLLHVSGLASVRGLQDLQNVLHSHVPLQVGLAVHL